MQANVAAGNIPGHGNLTVAQLLAEWERNALPAQELSPRTIEVYQWCVQVLTESIGPRRADRLTPEHVDKAFAVLAECGRAGEGRPVSRASLIKIRSVLGKALEYGVRRQLVARNVARVVQLPTTARRGAAGRSLIVEQANQLLASTADHRLHALWRLMLMTGLRPGEATGLTWTDVDFDEGLIHVRRSLKLEQGKLCVTDTLKTTRSRRSLKAHASIIDALRQHQASQEREERELGEHWWNVDNLVFTTATGRPIDPNNLRRVFRGQTEAAGLGRWHPHELRHSTASILSAAGVPLERIADVLGHDGTRMTALVYRHVVSPTIDGAMAMGDALG